VIKKTFENVMIESNHLHSFIHYFGFANRAPLSYLYILAQRAQISIMLDKQFTLAIPGMIHVENYLTKFNQYMPDEPFDIKGSVQIEYKESGSLIPVFFVELYQKKHLIASCKSIYLVKRKSGKPKKKEEQSDIEIYDYHDTWDLKKSSGKEYAKISGDKNPIHTSLIFAKLFGFKSTIMHGWYSVCRIEKNFENNYDFQISQIDTMFKTPVFLPEKPILKVLKKSQNQFKYQLINNLNSKIYLEGTIL